MDGFDTLVPDDLKKSTAFMASFAYHVDMSDQRAPRKPLK
jgi:hypothetical protein